MKSDTATKIAGLLVLARKKTTIGVISPRHIQSSELMNAVESRLREVPDWLLEYYKATKHQMCIETPNGRAYFISNVDKMRGMEYNAVFIDEYCNADQIRNLELVYSRVRPGAEFWRT